MSGEEVILHDEEWSGFRVIVVKIEDKVYYRVYLPEEEKALWGNGPFLTKRMAEAQLRKDLVNAKVENYRASPTGGRGVPNFFRGRILELDGVRFEILESFNDGEGKLVLSLKEIQP